MAKKPATIDEYLRDLPADRREALKSLRAAIRAIVPAAEECISYGMPAFRVEGHVVAGFQATRAGCSYYPFSGATLDALADRLDGFGRTKSALHFDPGKGLPTALLRKLIAERRREIRRMKTA